ncbi:hypothetical protein JDV02_005057 [Purpureocillium takamizusanense]|uniref:Uncharacterized protein n=1 Tax=Purpureocillium takamizusanense TaxID=2060973 RepID=A0A9Q8QFR3_9HYPO|nr:uncharacterized protein JDV02_005057 [Purpureocillium takamizusanense]UNI18810.1 hypothetical protein JDV02_005057 [Purpureocillium takamizusanense]
MVSFRAMAIAGLLAAADALPATYRLSPRQVKQSDLFARQDSKATPEKLSVPDSLTFPLVAEQAENKFYQEGFQKFPESDFAALGLNQQQIADLKSIGRSEEQHVVLLQSALAQAGIQPVQECEYNFQLKDAKDMVQKAALFENIGVSAYLGAAGLIDPSVLGTAASIVTVESRHQTAIRIFSGMAAIPQALDVPMSPRSVFTMLSAFIKKCPQPLNLQAFPALTMEGTDSPKIGASVRPKAASGASGAKHCAFTSGSAPVGNTVFSDFRENEGCVVPQGVAGVAYMTLTKEAPADGMLTDENIVAGPMAMVIT